MEHTNHSIASFVDRFESIESQQADLRQDKSDLLREIKSQGLDTKILKDAIKFKKLQAYQREEYAGTFLAYCEGLGLTEFDVLARGANE